MKIQISKIFRTLNNEVPSRRKEILKYRNGLRANRLNANIYYLTSIICKSVLHLPRHQLKRFPADLFYQYLFIF